MAKWIVGAVALVAVIAVTAVVAVSCTKSSGGSDKPTAAPTTSGAPTSDFASANDTGPVSVITEDPSCAPWMPILNTLADSQTNGWKQRDPSVPADLWSPDVRSQFRAVGQAMRSAADQTKPLIKLTTHRVMRELYEQFIVYSSAYADSIPSYTPADNHLADTSVSTGEVLSRICQAITFGAAQARAPLVPAVAAPEKLANPSDSKQPTRFLTEKDPVCADWTSAVDAYGADPVVAAWVKTDSNIPASQWSQEQRAANDAVAPVMQDLADTLERLGRSSANPTFQDFATLSAQYQRAYVLALPTYTKADENLYGVARITQGIIVGACASVGV